MNKYYIEPVESHNSEEVFVHEAFNALIALNIENAIPDKVEVYSVCDGGHCTATLEYLKTCKEISKEEYIKLTKSYQVPEEYIK